MRTFIPSEYNHQDIDPNFLNSNINTASHSKKTTESTPESKSETKAQGSSYPRPNPTLLETNDFLLPLIFLLLYLMEKEENK